LISDTEAERVVEDEVMAAGDDKDDKINHGTITSASMVLAVTDTTTSRSVKGSARSAHAGTFRSPAAQTSSPREVLPNPLLDIARLRVPSKGRGVLVPGAVFRGTQTSGRSSYEVEVRIVVSMHTRLGILQCES
jgi:hypothetical protein